MSTGFTIVGRAEVGVIVKGPVPLMSKSIVSVFFPLPAFTRLIAHLSDPCLPSSRVLVTVKVESKTRSSSRCMVEMQNCRFLRSFECLDLFEGVGNARRSVLRIADILECSDQQ